MVPNSPVPRPAYPPWTAKTRTPKGKTWDGAELELYDMLEKENAIKTEKTNIKLVTLLEMQRPLLTIVFAVIWVVLAVSSICIGLFLMIILDT